MPNNQSKTPLIFMSALLLGAGMGGLATYWMASDNPAQSTSDEQSNEPLYWVAPMDPNYKRDQPGKSPMGMDLIPVYAEEAGGADEGPGAIKISPEVINNLGVRVAEATHQPLHSEIITVGYVKYDEDRLIHIHPRISGWVDKLYVKAAGDPVHAGEPLYSLYSPELVNAQEELLLALNRKNERLIQAAQDRLRALQISEETIETLKKTRVVEQTVTFYAPQTGVVDNLNIREGYFVQPGTTMLSVGALEKVWVEAEVFEKQAALVQTGDSVTMTLDYFPGKSWHGTVDYIYPTLDKKTRTARVRLRFDNADSLLKPNMFAQVSIHSNSQEQVVAIPKEALIRTGRQNRVVLSLGDGRFKSIAVRIGQEDDEFVEVIEGLKAGESIVTSAQFLLDSESSKTSDFKRMHHEPQAASVWVAATIKSAMPEHLMVTATHEAIEQWQWPAMTMDFSVSESLDISALKPNVELHMEITQRGDNDYEITGIHIMSDGESSNVLPQASVQGEINAINFETRAVNITRGPIEKWNRPSATMDFIAADDIKLGHLDEGMQIDFTFEIDGDDFVIIALSHDNQAKSHEEALNHDHHGDMDMGGEK